MYVESNALHDVQAQVYDTWQVTVPPAPHVQKEYEHVQTVTTNACTKIKRCSDHILGWYGNNILHYMQLQTLTSIAPS